MGTKKDITPCNEKGQRHGYWEEYHYNGKLRFRANYVNGIMHGHWEAYHWGGELAWKGVYDNAKQVGLWIEDGKEYFYAH